MMISNERISISISHDKMELVLESYRGEEPPELIVDQINDFLASKGIKFSVENTSFIDAFHKDEKFLSSRPFLIRLEKGGINSGEGNHIIDLITAQKWMRDLETKTTAWLNGQKSKDSPRYFDRGEVVMELRSPSQVDCYGNNIKAWDPCLWIPLSLGLEIKAIDGLSKVVTKASGYLMAKSNRLYLQPLEMISSDDMKRHLLTLEPEHGKTCWRNHFESLLDKYGINEKKSSHKILLEIGLEPQPSKAGSIHLFFPGEKNWHQGVECGDVLASVTPSKPGVDGLTVTGKKIPAINDPIDPLRLSIGKGVAIEEQRDGSLHYVSTKKGCVTWINEVLNVESILELNSDLNIELSPIRYDGPVVIKGDVLSGATIECQDILVSGMIENNVHFLCKGDVEVAGGIVGDDTKIEAKNIKARHVQSATLISSTSVEIKSFVYGAKIYAMGSIFIHGEKLPEKNNALVGGVCSAFESIQVHSVGSEMNATVICAGVDLRLWESCEQAKSLARSLKQEVQVIQKDLPIDDLQKHGIDALDSERKSLVTHQLKDIQKKLSQRQRLLDRLNTEKEQCFNVNREKIFISMNKGFSPDVMVMVCGEQKILRKSKSGQLCLKAVGQNIELNSQSSNGSSS